jgi:hypothetical protein
MKKNILFLFILFSSIFTAIGQNVSFTATAPAAVENNAQFRVVYTVNGQGTDFRVGEFEDFIVVMGPSTSHNQSISIVNGQTQSSVSTSYTFILQAQKEGTFTIPAASIIVDRQKYFSNSLTVKVLPEDSQEASSSQQNIGGVEVFVRAIPSKTTVFEQEVVLLTFKLYVRSVNVVNFSEMKFPETKGFLAREIEQPGDRQWKLETYNNKNYNTVILKETLLFPQRAGEQKIEAGNFEAILRIPRQTNSRGAFFDNFFNSYQDVKKTASSSPVTINVKPIPLTGRPKSFANAVGNFTLKSSINTTELKVNEPITVKVEISGNGNLQLIKNPEIEFPANFEIYDPKVESNFKNTETGVTGTKIIEYLAIPRYAGNFTIPSTEFSYFDPRTKTFKTLRTENYDIKVEDGGEIAGTENVVSNFANKTAVNVFGTDIHHINTKNTNLKPKNDFFFGSTGFVLWLIFPMIIAIVLFIAFRKYVKENANIALVRTKKANKVAIKRLKTAQKYMEQGNKVMFYDEVLKALWGYFSDKLSIPPAKLNKDNIEIELSQAGVDKELIDSFMDILSTCEYAQYAPSSDEGEMEHLYDKTVDKMGELEEKIKR